MPGLLPRPRGPLPVCHQLDLALVPPVRPGHGRVPDPAGRLKPGILALCCLHRRRSRGSVHLAPRPPLHRSAARASAVGNARRCPLRAQHTGDASLPWPGPSPSRCRRPPRGRYCRCWCASILGLGPGDVHGVILGMMGIGGVTSGMLLPFVRGRMNHSNATVVGMHPVLLLRHHTARAVAPLATCGFRYAAVRRRLDLGLRNDPGGRATGLPALGTRPRTIDLPVGTERRAHRRLVRFGVSLATTLDCRVRCWLLPPSAHCSSSLCATVRSTWKWRGRRRRSRSRSGCRRRRQRNSCRCSAAPAAA